MTRGGDVVASSWAVRVTAVCGVHDWALGSGSRRYLAAERQRVGSSAWEARRHGGRLGWARSDPGA